MVSLSRESFKVFKELGDAIKCPLIEDYTPGMDYDTKFSYALDSEGLENAKEGLQGLRQAAPYVLMFNDKIKKFEIEDHVKGFGTPEIIQVKRQKTLNENSQTHIQFFKFQSLKKTAFVFGQNKYSKIAISITKNNNGNYEITNLNKEVPNFFVDYPLVGSEDLKCSMVFDSHYFFPNEKRSGIALEKGDKANINR